MIRRPPRSTLSSSSAASDVYKRQGETIVSLAHLKWGFYRLFVDGLLWYGNVRTAFKETRDEDSIRLEYGFRRYRLDTEEMKKRGPSLGLKSIAIDNRYLVSEMACKSYGDDPKASGQLKKDLFDAFDQHELQGGGN